jgi:hypothetical protein
MALSINDPETDRLARALAEATGESITAAIERSASRLVSAGTVIEASRARLRRFGERGEAHLDAPVRALKAEVRDVDADQRLLQPRACAVAR